MRWGDIIQGGGLFLFSLLALFHVDVVPHSPISYEIHSRWWFVAVVVIALFIGPALMVSALRVWSWGIRIFAIGGVGCWCGAAVGIGLATRHGFTDGVIAFTFLASLLMPTALGQRSEPS